MAAIVSSSSAAVAGAIIPARDVTFARASSRTSLLFGHRMQELCAAASRLRMTAAAGASGVPAPGFAPVDGKAELGAATGGLLRPQASTEGTVETAEAPAAADPVAALKLESDLLKKKAKREELRRKRLVRKRHLRKKGRWPPSKMKKLKNV